VRHIFENFAKSKTNISLLVAHLGERGRTSILLGIQKPSHINEQLAYRTKIGQKTKNLSGRIKISEKYEIFSGGKKA